MDISATIDWISATDHEPKNHYPGMGINVETAPGMFSYSDGAIFPDTGLWTMWAPTKPAMGLHLMYSGQTIRNITARGMRCDDLLKMLVGFNCKITRVDLAIDLHGLTINLNRIKQAIIRHEYTGRERYYDSHESSDDGFSIYVGAPSSDRRLRVYNKSAEQKLPFGQWFRAELQLRRKVSTVISRAFSQNTMGNLHNTAWSTISQIVPHLQSADFREFGRDTDVVGVPSIPRETDTEKWLIQSIAPAIARFRHENPESKALLALRRALGYTD